LRYLELQEDESLRSLLRRCWRGISNGGSSE
jgi:hypothetical protein